MIGSTLSHYRVLERLGEGGPGAAWKAFDLDRERLVAIKILPSGAGFGDEAKRRLLAQAAATAALGDPRLCAVLDTGETGDGEVYVVTPFCDGETLADRLRLAPLPPGRAIDLAGRIAATVARAHSHGLVHGDLKPGNVFLAASGEVRLVDFGQGQSGQGAALAYRSPEQLRHEVEADPPSDVWALGVLLYQLLTGRLPFAASDTAGAADLLTAIEAGGPAPLPAAAPPALGPILATALAREASRRYPDAAELRDDLAGAEGTQILPASLGTTLFEMPISGFEVTERGARSGKNDVRADGGGAGPGEASGPGSGPGSGMIGRTVAHYRILDHLGTGGMGIVYKAADTKLERTVALKFLPYALTRDQRAKERFLQEARAASAIDHQNICTIHEVGETAEGQLYLAMSAYEGETLARRIERGPLPVAEAVDIARQTAKGLAKAHSLRIVHRDVKPANLMLTKDGLVKILDFGIAKLAGAAGGTRVGFAIGTPAYMSPEQARGEDVDQRTDLWSLGVVLYEMLTAERPFRGDDREAVVAAVQRSEPARLASLRPEVPPDLERIVGRMLAKSPDDRYPSTSEAVADLDRLDSPPPPVIPPRNRLLSWLGAGVALALLGVGGYLAQRGGAKPQFQHTVAHMTDLEGSEMFPSLAPDDHSLLFAKTSASGRTDVYVQHVGEGLPTPLTANLPGGYTEPAYSPDGRSIAFAKEDGGIFVSLMSGGPARKLASFGFNPSWTPDGDVLFATENIVDNPSRRLSTSAIWRASPKTGKLWPIERGDAVQPSCSPHGHRIAFWGIPSNSSRRVIWTIPSTGGPPVPVTEDGSINWDPVWAPDGKYLYFVSDRSGSMNLWRVSIDEVSGRPLGDAESITTPAQSIEQLSFARDGRRILYATNEGRSNIERLPFDFSAGRAVGAWAAVTQGSKTVRSADVSPDGKWVVFDVKTPKEDIYVVRSDGQETRQLTDDAYKNRVPRWSPNGQGIVFYSNRARNFAPWFIRAFGRSPEALTPSFDFLLTDPIWSPDGRRLVCGQGYRGAAALIDLSLPLPSRRPIRLPDAGPHGEAFSANSWSPDGRRLAGTVSGTVSGIEQNLPGIVTYSFAERRYEKVTQSGSGACWLPDSQRLLYIDQGSIFIADSRTRASTRLLDPLSNSHFSLLSVNGKNREIYAVRALDDGDIWMLTLN